MGQAIFSNIYDLRWGLEGRKYNSAVKRFKAELKKQKINLTCKTGFLKNFLESSIITEDKIKRIFKLPHIDISCFLYAEITIFTWE